MPAINNFQYSHTNNDFSAIAIEQFVQDEWVMVQNQFCPILACIEDNDLNWNKGFEVKRPKIAIPVAYETVAAISASTLGKSRASMIPTAWPNFQDLTGFTHATYDIAYLEHSIVMTPVDKRMLKNGERGNSMTAKVKSTLAAWARAKNAMMASTSGASETRLQGIPHACSNANTVGGISQSSYSWWQSNPVSGVATLLESTVRSDFDLLAQKARNKQTQQQMPDLLLADYVPGGFDVYGKIESFIVGQERYFHKDFFVKYGLTGFAFKNMKVVMNPSGTGGSYLMLNTGTWYYLGDETPTQDPESRLFGSGSYELHYSEMASLGCGDPALNLYRTGITA